MLMENSDKSLKSLYDTVSAMSVAMYPPRIEPATFYLQVQAPSQLVYSASNVNNNYNL